MGAGELLAVVAVIAFAWKALIDAVGPIWGFEIPIFGLIAPLVFLWMCSWAEDVERQVWIG